MVPPLNRIMKLRNMILSSCWKAQLLISVVVAFAAPISHVDAFGNFRTASHIRWKNDHSRLRNRMHVVLFQDSSQHISARYNGDMIDDDDTTEVNNEFSTSEPQMNFFDIIRMLRANPHQCTTPIETASDVLHLMSHSVSPSASNTTPVSSIEEIVKSTSPNIAAAALRRLVSTPFIPLTFSTTKKFSQYLYKNQWSNPKNEVEEKERQLYGQLIQLLLRKLSTAVDGQLQALMESTNNNHDQSSPPPKLLPKKETWHQPPSSPTKENNMRLNWYAMADLLSSLSVLRNIPQNKSRSSSPRNGYLQVLMRVKEEEDGNNGIAATITSLFHDTIQCLAWDNKVTSSFIRCIGSRRLIRDLLHPLVIAATQQQRESEEVSRWDESNFDDDNNTDDDYPLNSEKNLHHLMAVASEYLGSPSSLAKVSAADLSIAMWSLTQIYQPSRSHHQKLQSYRSFIKACMKRLRKRSVISPARGCDITLAIRSVERLLGLLDREDDDNDDESPLQPFQDILSLPLKLPGEEDMLDSYIPSLQTNTYGTLPPPTTAQNDGLAVADDLRSEAVTMFHTLVNELLFQPPGGNAQIKLRSLSLQQVADILQTAVALNVSRDDLQTATIEVLDYLMSDPFVLDQTYSCRDISRTLLSLQRLRVGTGIYNLDLEKSGVQRLGARFLEIVDRQSKGRTRGKCDPKTLTTVVRSGVLMFPRSESKSILNAASILIRDDTIPVDVSDHNDVIFVDYGVTVPFLERCNDYELSWLLWTFAISRRFDKNVFIALTDQILENISDDSFTASSASRVMWSTSVLLSMDEAGDQHDGRHIDLFHQLSPILLSSHLSPTDLSCAMYAIAKTNYVFDRGVFDFLAEELASDESLEHANTRLISQAVWACGKMAEFEDPIMSSTESLVASQEDAAPNQPPYLNNVYKMLTFLIRNKAHMTPKHVAETIWAAFGRLSISDQYYLEELSGIAARVAPQCNSREIANIVWGLSKVDYADDPQLICTLVRVITNSNLKQKCTSQEAANCIYALGRLGVRDQELFSALSSIIKNQIHDANSQAIANSLWGHDVVGLPAPPELLSVWARDTLGMDTYSAKYD
ncbi:hypothetical protein QTG54_008680 [Skeletonema marinoi]|uniref:Uncharacterized protein n=2 Tax=Skeletonema marinoi TaxID=267567 RepID=A0AAD8Y8R3_9STRA|nr:hypothetical protein QTG54_008680 [Skeletonema marinoi]